MRKLVLIIIVGLAAIVTLPHAVEAKGVKLTKQQVQTVCDGATYCTTECGLKGEHLCEFKCKGNTCSGNCQSCGVKSARVFPNLYSNRLVRRELRASP
ncbi:MAG: hypothetical protein AB7G54_08125 [Methyloceanibacter sp.]